jgi:N-acetylglucosaminyl-diphospho-decaprenol L-rhamnosyltransferase
MDLAVIVVSWNVRQLLVGCLTSVEQSLADSAHAGIRLDARIWVVDNASSDGSPDIVRTRFPDVHLLPNTENRGFAAANNQGLTLALADEPRHLLLLNPDTVVRGRALETLVHFLDNTDRAGMAGARLVFGDGSFQHSAFAFPGLAQLAIDLFPVPARLHDTRLNGRYPRTLYAADAPPFPVDHPLGAAMLVRRAALQDAGLMDTGFFMYCEEIDWAMRFRQAGWQIFCVPQAEIVHYGGQSTAQIQATSLINLWRSRHRLYHKHYSPFRTRLAAWLVRLAMGHRANQPGPAALQDAYRQIAVIWSKP